MSRTLLAPAAPIALFVLAGCATLDGAPGRRYHPPAEQAALPAHMAPTAHGPAARGSENWVVSVTPEELAALGLGQQMELDVQAPGVVYVVDYRRLGQLDGVFARTASGLFPLRALLKEEYDAGRVVLRTRREHDLVEKPASQPTEPKAGGGLGASGPAAEALPDGPACSRGPAAPLL